MSDDLTLNALANIPDLGEMSENRESLLIRDLIASVEDGEIYQVERILDKICTLRCAESDLTSISLETVKDALHGYSNVWVELIMRDCGLSEKSDSEIARTTGYSLRQVRRNRETIRKSRKKGTYMTGSRNVR